MSLPTTWIILQQNYSEISNFLKTKQKTKPLNAAIRKDGANVGKVYNFHFKQNHLSPIFYHIESLSMIETYL